jgi:TatA/E family protein of Tat protein translocase
LKVTGYSEWLVIIAVIVVVFSFRKLPQIGGALADSIKSFKKGIRGENPPPREVTEYKPDSPKKSD